jgi:hypothetical protein
MKGEAMYPVSLGYGTAKQRIGDLMSNGHHAEALVTTTFTVEKTLRRTLRHVVVSCGFQSKMAEKIVEGFRGLDAIKKGWELYDPQHRTLPAIVGAADWETFHTAATMRNKMVHGERVYDLAHCQRQANDALAALDRLKATLDREYGYSGWERLRVRKVSRLHVDPVRKWPKPKARKSPTP